jgi:hypothetical protein
MPSSRGGNRTGQICSHQRPTDYYVPILGQNLSDIGEDYEDALHGTVRRGMDDKCCKDYRCRQLRIAEFWKKNCPQYYKVRVQEVAEDDLNDRTKFYFQRYKFDLKYSGIDVNYVLHFLMQNDTKADGKLKSFQDIQKYRDAILLGSKVVDERIPQAFYEKTEGDGMAMDGSRLFFVPASAGLPRDHGHNSNIERQQYADVLDLASTRKKKPPKKKPPPMPKKPPPIANKPPPITTTCAIKGCTFGTVLHANHKCYNKCGRVFHNLCAQMNDLCDNDNELDMYCSMEYKRSKE